MYDAQERREIRAARYDEAIREFRDRDVTYGPLAVSVFRARLIALGLGPDAIRAAIIENTPNVARIRRPA